MRRDTKQRDAIRQALVDEGRPLSVSELFELAHSRVAGLGIATVYRSLRSLHEEGQIKKVDLPGEPPRWELAPETHHHHFLCLTCDKLFEIKSCPEDLQQLLPKGYTLEDHDILLRGQCEVCSANAKSAIKHK